MILPGSAKQGGVVANVIASTNTINHKEAL
jgi:hypothetical protein